MAWEKTGWTWGGDHPELVAKEPKYAHAIHVPGLGWFGGLPVDLARYIVSLAKAVEESDT